MLLDEFFEMHSEGKAKCMNFSNVKADRVWCRGARQTGEIIDHAFTL